jgi:hypothetical protein
VADEMSMPTIAEFKNGDDPSAQELDISGEFDKTITKNVGVSISDTWIHLNVPGGGNVQGFANLETSFKYQFLTDPAAELAMSVSLDVDWRGTGNRAVGADPFTTLTPTLFLGNGAEVRNASGARVDHGKSISGNVMRLSVGALSPGSYSVTWHVLSADTHTT